MIRLRILIVAVLSVWMSAPAATQSPGPIVLLVSPTSDLKSVADFVAWAKRSNKPLTYSTSGPPAQRFGEALAQKFGIRIVHVPYRAASQGILDLIGGQIDFSVVDVDAALGLIQVGLVTALAVAAKQRIPGPSRCPDLCGSGLSRSGWGVARRQCGRQNDGNDDNVLPSSSQHLTQRLPMPGIDENRQFIPLKIAVLTVSDTRALADDKSGATLADRIKAAGHTVHARAIVTDDVAAIRARVQEWIDAPDVDVIISTGGTGFTGRDVTPEAVEPLFEKKMEGFATLFLMVSHAKIGTSAIQTRATAGVAGATYIFCLPGSPGACRDAWDEILVHQLDYRYRPCNFVEIMPRLDEHLRRGKAKGATV